MDSGTIHGIWTLMLFVCFIGVIWWAFGKNQKSRFDEAANLIFDDEEHSVSKDQGVKKQ